MYTYTYVCERENVAKCLQLVKAVFGLFLYCFYNLKFEFFQIKIEKIMCDTVLQECKISAFKIIITANPLKQDYLILCLRPQR